MRWVSRLTTATIIVGLVLAVVLGLRSLSPNAEIGGGFHTWVRVRDASRLQEGSSVVIAGVRVGDIDDLVIEGRLARIDLSLRDDLQIPVDSFVTRRSDSLFGDNYLEIVPGKSKVMLEPGQPLMHVEEGGSTDATLRTIAHAMPKVDTALDRAHEFMVEGRKWVNGSMSKTVSAVDRWLDNGGWDKPLASADRGMERFENGATAAADAIANAAPTVSSRLRGFNDSITKARVKMADAKKGIVEALANARKGMDRIDEPVADMAEVMAAIDEGHGDDWKGSLGRLINDPGPADTIEDLTDSAAEGAAGLVRFKSWLGGQMEYNIRQRSMRYYASAELYARSDQFYLIEFERSLLGGAPIASLNEVPGSDQFTRTQDIADKLRFTLQYGKRIGMLQLRAGLKDSTPGVGADALFFHGRLKISTDLFGSFTRVPRLKVAGALAVFRSLYILAGVDDALNAPGELPIRLGNTEVPVQFEKLTYGRDYFLGLGLRLTDRDLATMLRFYGAVIAAYALAP